MTADRTAELRLLRIIVPGTADDLIRAFWGDDGRIVCAYVRFVRQALLSRRTRAKGPGEAWEPLSSGARQITDRWLSETGLDRLEQNGSGIAFRAAARLGLEIVWCTRDGAVHIGVRQGGEVLEL